MLWANKYAVMKRRFAIEILSSNQGAYFTSGENYYITSNLESRQI